MDRSHSNSHNKNIHQPAKPDCHMLHQAIDDCRLLKVQSWDSTFGMRDGKKEYISRFMMMIYLHINITVVKGYRE